MPAWKLLSPGRSPRRAQGCPTTTTTRKGRTSNTTALQPREVGVVVVVLPVAKAVEEDVALSLIISSIRFRTLATSGELEIVNFLSRNYLLVTGIQRWAAQQSVQTASNISARSSSMEARSFVGPQTTQKWTILLEFPVITCFMNLSMIEINDEDQCSPLPSSAFSLTLGLGGFCQTVSSSV